MTTLLRSTQDMAQRTGNLFWAGEPYDFIAAAIYECYTQTQLIITTTKKATATSKQAVSLFI